MSVYRNTILIYINLQFFLYRSKLNKMKKKDKSKTQKSKHKQNEESLTDNYIYMNIKCG